MEDDRHIVTLTVQELQDALIPVVVEELKQTLRAPTRNEKEEEDITKTLITRKQLAKMFGVSTVSLDKWKRAGLLPKPVKMAGRVYYIRKEIMEMITKRKSK